MKAVLLLVAISACREPPPPAMSAARPPPTAAVTRHPDEPSSPSRTCKLDDDCALLPDDCTSCPPCEATWRKAATKATVTQVLASRPPCPPIGCPRCPDPPPGPAPIPTGYIGTRATCEKGQCVAALPAPP